ncbi:MAG: methionine--tRNA ligase [Phycisphaeraceae bacterium]|nr:MAG: methionine--tRNA ligase [Phycisphaeraceae bacterium]
MEPYYATTPIYYVNDRPHIGHCFTSVLADAAARFARLVRGGPGDVFFLTGTDEHADKVVTSAASHGMTPLQWADRNAAEFQSAFAFMNVSNDDFIRTTQPRHTAKVHDYIRRLQTHGDVFLGDYTGWWDESQEEYLTETVAKDSPHGPYTSPVTGRPLVKRTEKNYFFRLSAYQDRLAEHLAKNPGFILPESRRNEVLGRLRDGLADIPVSRAVTADPASQWGIRMPDDPGHRIYVWIDALFNYLSAVDTPDRRRFWPPAVHLMAKDILWFHAVIWPCLLMALGEPLPRTLFVHSYWVRDGKKMSKSLGNFVDLDVLKAYADRYSLDALRWYLLTQGPLANTDADFSHAKFVEVYNADLANGIGNSTSRVANMIDKYFNGVVPQPPGTIEQLALDDQGLPHDRFNGPALCGEALGGVLSNLDRLDLASALADALSLVRRVDLYINETTPFKLAKNLDTDPTVRPRLAAILYNCAETLRVASVLLSPAMPGKMASLWRTWNCAPTPGATLADAAAFGGPCRLAPGSPMTKGEPLFMRADPAEPEPRATA